MPMEQLDVVVPVSYTHLLCSRYSERVLILLGTFQARSFEELFQGVKALPWEEWIGQNDIFPVKMCIRDSAYAAQGGCSCGCHAETEPQQQEQAQQEQPAQEQTEKQNENPQA